MEIRPFARELAVRGELDLNRLSKEAAVSLESAGIARADLEKIAGADQVIRGEEFEQIFSLIEARAEKSGANDIGRAQKVYESLSKELDRTVGGAQVAQNGFARAGLRDEMQTARAGGKRAEYQQIDLPDVPSERRTPDKPSWFARLLERIFGWLPGVTTDTERTLAYGRDLADRHAAEIIGFRAGNERNTMAHGPFNELGNPVIDDDSAMIGHLSERFQREHHVSEEEADSRARVVVAAMNERLGKTLDAGAAARSSVPGIVETDSSAAKELGSLHAIVKDEVGRGGPLWQARLDRAMAAPPADHRYFSTNPGKSREEIINGIKRENLEMVAYTMALEKAGGLENIPREAVDGLLDAHFSGKVGDFAAADAISALDSMSSREDGDLYAKLEAVPDARRAIAYQVLAKEHFVLRSKNPAERAGGIARVSAAADQLRSNDPKDVARAMQAFDEGRLGLEQHNIQLEHTVKGKKVTTSLPVFFHPSVSAERRAHYSDLIKEAYQLQPQPLIASMLAGEGGKGTHVQVLPDGAIYPAINENLGPTGSLSFFERERNLVRINTTAIEQFEAREGREGAVNLVIHESAHLVDDLGDPDQVKGFFIDRADQHNRELASAHRHFETQRDRFTAITGNMSDPEVHRYHELRVKREKRTDAEETEFQAVEKKLLARSGSVSDYGAHGGTTRFAGQGGQISEWFAETYTHFVNPATRDHLREVDPVAHRAMERIQKDLENGVPAVDAVRKNLRFSLSTEISAAQGSKALSASGVNARNLERLDSITTAFEDHGRALDGWKAFDKDAQLRKMRQLEATRGATNGKTLLADIRAQLDTMPAGPDKTKLAAIEKRLAQAIDTLERNAKKI